MRPPTTVPVRTLERDHATFGPAVADLLRLADDCPELSTTDLYDRLEQALAFLDHQLLPHSIAEEAVFYPVVAEILGGPQASETMVRDHDELRRLAKELRRRTDELGGQLLPAARREVVHLLDALHAVLTLHLANEDELYLPLLERELGEDRSSRLLRSVREAAAAVEADGLAADGG